MKNTTENAGLVSQYGERKVALFDMDGTLVETDAANAAAYRSAMTAEGIRLVANFGGRITKDVVAKAVLAGRVMGRLPDILERKIAQYGKELWRTELGPASEAFRRIVLNRRRFPKLVLLSNSAERRVMETLGHHGLREFFDEIVCNAGHGDKYANYFRHSDADPAMCVVWENEEAQIRSAIAAGVRVENIRKVG